jgi:hypothetical protein
MSRTWSTRGWTPRTIVDSDRGGPQAVAQLELVERKVALFGRDEVEVFDLADA